MHTVRRLIATGALVLATFALLAPAALAQTSGEYSQVPEAAPTNWSWQFMAVPIFLVSVLLIVVFWMIYARIMVRARYPRPRKS